MDLFGIGSLELVFVLLVATIVLGPAKMVELARNLGNYWREAQRMLRETADAATVKLDQPLIPEDGEQTPEPPPEGAVASGNGVGSSVGPGQDAGEALSTEGKPAPERKKRSKRRG